MSHMWATACAVSILIALVSSQVTAPPQYNGQKGDRGDVGSPGTNGSPGAEGSKGNPGVAGPTGDKGDKGVRGLSGQSAPSAGVAGATGATGAPGVVGATGSLGLPGSTGDTGATGSSGVTGEKGSQGSVGAPGDVGVKGEKGQRGFQGDNGDRGVKGAKGAPGEPGFRGTTGPDGLLGYPFEYDAAKYSSGCLELEGHTAKNCGGYHYCQDIVDTTDTVTGECRCLDGYSAGSGGCTNNLYPSGRKDCSNNNGGCQQVCSNGRCQCLSGYSLKATGKCIDIDECSTGGHECHSTHNCLNLLGSYKCLQNPDQLVTDARVVGNGLVNEHLLLALLLWVLLLLIIVVGLIIGVCCLDPVKAPAPGPPVVTTVEYITAPARPMVKAPAWPMIKS